MHNKETSMNPATKFFRNFISFYIKVAIIHTSTYIFFGMLFSNMFDYSTVYSMENVSNFMRDFDSKWILAGPFLQPIRAFFIALALYPLINTFKASKLGWLMIWSIFACIGILASPGASPGSIEGIIYTKLPLKFQMIGLPEVLLQTFLFSFLLWVVIALPFQSKEISSRSFLIKFIKSLIVSICGVILFSMAGVINFMILGIDTSNAKSVDKSVVAMLSFLALFNVISSYILAPKVAKKTMFNFILIPIYFIIYVGIPFAYNKITDSIYNTVASIVLTSLVAVAVSILSFFIFKNFKKEKVIEELTKIEYKAEDDNNKNGDYKTNKDIKEDNESENNSEQK